MSLVVLVLCSVLGVGYYIFIESWSGCGGAKSSSTLSNIKQLGIATLMYCEDFDGRYPTVFGSQEEMQVSLNPYTKNEQIFKTINPDGGEFLPNSKFEGQLLETVIDPEHKIMLFETMGWKEREDRRAAAFADSHAKFISETEIRSGLRVKFLVDQSR